MCCVGVSHFKRDADFQHHSRSANQITCSAHVFTCTNLFNVIQNVPHARDRSEFWFMCPNHMRTSWTNRTARTGNIVLIESMTLCAIQTIHSMWNFYVVALTGSDTGCIRRPTKLQWINKARNKLNSQLVLVGDVDGNDTIQCRTRFQNCSWNTVVVTMYNLIRMPTSVYLYEFAVDSIIRSDSRILRFFNGFIYSSLDFNTGTIWAQKKNIHMANGIWRPVARIMALR